MPKNGQGNYEVAVSATAKPTYQDKTTDNLGNGSGKFDISKTG